LYDTLSFAKLPKNPLERLKELGYILPPPPEPVALYLPVVKVKNLVITSGILPLVDGRIPKQGRVGENLNIEEGKEQARIALLNALSILNRECRGLNTIERIIRLEGYVSSPPHFSQHSFVMNGASELLEAIFGEKGKHTRVSVGVSSLPLLSPVEISLWVEIQPGGGRRSTRTRKKRRLPIRKR
jgi:enamine deaminase RidA (YjgF/YER057c/UK114 family)